MLTSVKIPDVLLRKVMLRKFIENLKESTITQCKKKLHPEGRVGAKSSIVKYRKLFAWYHP